LEQAEAAGGGVDERGVARLHRVEIGGDVAAVSPCIITAAAVRSSTPSGMATSASAGIDTRSAELPGA
jgi:hypothetical protein